MQYLLELPCKLGKRVWAGLGREETAGRLLDSLSAPVKIHGILPLITAPSNAHFTDEKMRLRGRKNPKLSSSRREFRWKNCIRRRANEFPEFFHPRVGSSALPGSRTQPPTLSEQGGWHVSAEGSEEGACWNSFRVAHLGGVFPLVILGKSCWPASPVLFFHCSFGLGAPAKHLTLFRIDCTSNEEWVFKKQVFWCVFSPCCHLRSRFLGSLILSQNNNHMGPPLTSSSLYLVPGTGLFPLSANLEWLQTFSIRWFLKEGETEGKVMMWSL